MVVVRGHKFCLFELRNCCGMCKWNFSDDGEVVHIRLAMVTLYWIAFLPPRKSYRIGILLTHMNGDFDTISMTERNCVTPISKVESHALDTLGVYTLPDNLSCRLNYFWLLFFAVFLCIIRDFKIQRRGRQRERQKNNRFNQQNRNFARASHFFVHFFPVFARLRRENA